MNKKIDFDIFDNTDDRIVEKLANNSILSKEEKERIYNMSKRKIVKKIRKSQNVLSAEHTMVDNQKELDTENERELNTSDVQDTNQPRKIKMSRFATIASAAACLIIVGGVSGILYSLNNVTDDTSSSSSPMTNVTSDISDNSSEVKSNDHESVSLNENDSSADSEEKDSDASVTTTSSAVTTTIAPVVDDDISKPKSDDSNNTQADMSQYIDISNDLINDMNTLYFLCIGGGVSYDLSQETYSVDNPESPYCNEEGYLVYNLVSDQNFKSTADISNFTSNTITDRFKNASNFNDILDPGSPKFVDYNGNLYGLYNLSTSAGGRGYSGYTTTSITDITYISFTAVLTDDPASEDGSKITLKIVNENGTWKVDEQL